MNFSLRFKIFIFVYKYFPYRYPLLSLKFSSANCYILFSCDLFRCQLSATLFLASLLTSTQLVSASSYNSACFSCQLPFCWFQFLATNQHVLAFVLAFGYNCVILAFGYNFACFKYNFTCSSFWQHSCWFQLLANILLVSVSS